MSDLPLGLTADALAAASAEPDPGSLAAATRLRTRFGPALAAAALHQAALLIPYYRDTNPAFAALGRRTVERVLEDLACRPGAPA